MQEERSTEQLLLDVQRLSAEVENLKRQKADLEILLETLEERTFADSLANLIALAIEGCERQRTQEALSKAKAQLEMTVGAPLNSPPPINCSASKLPITKEPK
jgi:hypothetical protein